MGSIPINTKNSLKIIKIMAVGLILYLIFQPGYIHGQQNSSSEKSLIDITLDAYLKGMVSNEKLPYREIKRKILGIYDSRGLLERFQYNKIQMHAAMILNHYGYVVEPMDIRKESLPNDKEMEEYDTILTWFTEPSIPSAIEYLIWIEKQAAKGKKLIIIGYTGLEVGDKTGENYPYDLKARLLRLIGLEYRGFSRRGGPKVYVDKKNSDMIEFERKLETYPGKYSWIVPLEDKEVKTWLRIGHKDFPNGRSSVVTTSPNGGYVMDGYAIWQEPEQQNARYKWLINPFFFFAEIFRNQNIPVPDPTTKNGKRVFFSHIDGDSFHSFSQIQKGKYSSEVLLDFFINEIPEIPVGVSFVVAEIDNLGVEGSEPYMVDPKAPKASDNKPVYIEHGRGNTRLMETAKRIAALPNIELASHTYHHPLEWRTKNKTSSYKLSPFNEDFEIRGSIDFVNKHFAPNDKKVKVLYWTGDTTPTINAFEILDEIGVDNLNGGDGVYDDHYNSLTSVSSYARKAGKYWQIFTCQSNENMYTNLWREDFNGLANVIETFERTEKPRRLQCANLYYHFYSGDKVAALNALRKVYRWARDQNCEMVFPSEYIAMVKGYLKTRIFQIKEGRYVVANRGQLNTLRLDKGDVDEENSIGVVKVDAINDSYYISLDPNVKYPVIQVD
ncbi:hypothetical protein KKA14_21920 [bacterium]|nr:hypothetical protein [bacterium]